MSEPAAPPPALHPSLAELFAFTGVALMHWPLPFVFLGLAPVSVAFAWFKR
jgi:hypothetical protein